MTYPDADMDRLTKVYIKIRDAKSAAAAAFKKQEAQFDEQLRMLERHILETMKGLGENVTSLRTEHGTIMKNVKSKFWTSDFDSFRKFALDNADKGALGLFENRISQKNMEQWIEQHPDLYPPGVNAERRYAITIRRAAAPSTGEDNV